MSAPIEQQLRDYFTLVDRTQAPVDTTTQALEAPVLSLVEDSHDSIHTNESTLEVVMLTPRRNDSHTTSHRWIMTAAAAVAAVALVGGLAFATSRTDDDPVPADQPELTVPSEPVEVSVVVPGAEQWTDTGVDLSVGDTVLIEADGAVTPAENSESLYGPDGVPDRASARRFNIDGLEDENHNGLIGRIGGGGAPFRVGSELRYTAETDGRLFLGVNDSDVSNNAGEFTANITVNRS